MLGMGMSVINSRFLGPADYGVFALIFSISDFINLFINFGFYSSGARLLALNSIRGYHKNEVIGNLIIIAIVLSLFSSILIFVFSFYAGIIFDKKVDHILRVFCLFLGLMSVQTMVESTCTGTNKVEALSMFRVGFKLLTLFFIVIFIVLKIYNLYTALFSTTFSLILSYIFIFWALKPKFFNIQGHFSSIFQDVSTYGFKAYLGDIASTASYRTDSLMISYFVNTTAVGYYRLASLLTYPMVSFSRSLSTALFRKFATENKINKKIFLLNFIYLMCCTFGLIALGKFIVAILFGLSYSPVAELVYPLAITALFGGLAQPLNSFLGVKGKGNYLRNAAFVLTVFNLTLNFALIPVYGAIGACYASLIALFVNFLIRSYYYKRTTRELI